MTVSAAHRPYPTSTQCYGTIAFTSTTATCVTIPPASNRDFLGGCRDLSLTKINLENAVELAAIDRVINKLIFCHSWLLLHLDYKNIPKNAIGELVMYNLTYWQCFLYPQHGVIMHWPQMWWKNFAIPGHFCIWNYKSVPEKHAVDQLVMIKLT